jgi:MFS transporter, ACS family, pantothenate transporter
MASVDVPSKANAEATMLSLSFDDAVTHGQTNGPKDLWIRLMTFLHWYPKNMAYAEKSLLLKLDLSILIFSCLSSFTKYLDQASITIAYVR